MPENPVLWRPDEARIKASAMYRFMRAQGFDDYDALHRWSIDDSPAFWQALVEFCGVRFDKAADRVLARPGDIMDAGWFEGSELNYAAHLLRHEGDRAALAGIIRALAADPAALARLRRAGLPYISILTDPTTGGVTASFAMLGDLNVAEPGALIGFAGPRVIKQTIGSELPAGFQSSEFLLDHGQLDQVVERRHLKKTVAEVLHWCVDGREVSVRQPVRE